MQGELQTRGLDQMNPLKKRESDNTSSFVIEMFRAVEKIDWVRDESMVVDRLKTGEAPPPDVQVPQF